MKLVRTLAQLRWERSHLPALMGIVPTMGALHEGHLSLVRRARSECASVGVSIFVNPRQFGPSEDLSTYPRDLDRDLGLLEPLGVDVVWAPAEEEMYPPGFQTQVSVGELSQPLEGAHRPGHFTGVATVVAKLFNAFQPDRAYFGQKDAQQVLVIGRMVRDLDFPIQVVVCPTVRESDGLAMSSRNANLDERERQSATVLYRALSDAVRAFQSGARDADALRKRMTDVLLAEPRVRVQYVSVAHPDTLAELHGPIDRLLLSMAVHVGKTRLIDNMLVGSEKEPC